MNNPVFHISLTFSKHDKYMAKTECKLHQFLVTWLQRCKPNSANRSEPMNDAGKNKGYLLKVMIILTYGKGGGGPER